MRIIPIIFILALMAVPAFADDIVRIEYTSTFIEHPDAQIMKVMIEPTAFLEMKDVYVTLKVISGEAVFDGGLKEKVDKLGDITDASTITSNVYLTENSSNFYEGIRIRAEVNYSISLGLKFKKKAYAESEFLGLWPEKMDIQTWKDDLEKCEKDFTELQDDFDNKMGELADKDKLSEALSTKNTEYLGRISNLTQENTKLLQENGAVKEENSELVLRNSNLDRKNQTLLFYKMLAGSGILLSILLIIILVTVVFKKNYYVMFEKPDFLKRKPKKDDSFEIKPGVRIHTKKKD